MQSRHILFRSVAAVVAIASGAAVAPVSAAAAAADVAAASAPSASPAEPAAWSKLSVQLRRSTKPGPVELVMPSRIGTMATQIVCNVYASGPESASSGGRTVRFAIDISCVGGTPASLEVSEMDIWRYPDFGAPGQVPGSFQRCDVFYSRYLSCVSSAPCFQAGSVYDGLARLFAIDDVGGTHSAVLYAPPRAVGCLV